MQGPAYRKRFYNAELQHLNPTVLSLVNPDAYKTHYPKPKLLDRKVNPQALSLKACKKTFKRKQESESPRRLGNPPAYGGHAQSAKRSGLNSTPNSGGSESLNYLFFLSLTYRSWRGLWSTSKEEPSRASSPSPLKGHSRSTIAKALFYPLCNTFCWLP